MTRTPVRFVLLSALALLSACKTDNAIMKPLDSLAGHRDARQARLMTEAESAMAAGRTQEALAHYSALYKQRKRDVNVAVNYAQLLRKTGNPETARDVLRRFSTDRGDAPLVRNEYAAALIATGDFAGAEKILNGVLEDKKAAEFHSDAQNLMGVALDAQGQHKEAEQMFRMALDHWKGNPSSVLNNLGLCLASEGMFDESLDTLRRGLIMAPDKGEIARNIKLVSDLRDRVVKKAPPAAKAMAKAKKKN